MRVSRVPATRKPARKIQRKAVTIAAGFRSRDGYLLCADAEYSHQTLKLPGQKIFPFNAPDQGMNVAIALAGNIKYGKSAIQHLKTTLWKQPSGKWTEPDLTSFVEMELENFHQAHIYKHPQNGYTGGPNFWLLIVASFEADKTVSMLSTEEAIVNKEQEYCAIGSGAEICNYIVGPLSKPALAHRPLKETVLVATHALYQVKKYVQGCGHTSHFMLIGPTGVFHSMVAFDLFAPDAYSEVFEQIEADLFFAAADLDMDDQRVTVGLDMTKRRIKEIREEQRREKQKRDELLAKLYVPMPC